MSLLRRKSFRLPQDSFVISDSDDEIRNSLEGERTVANSNVIEDSDTDRDNFHGNDSNAAPDESMESEEEDLQFMNNSHQVSIVESSSTESESESGEETNRRVNLKRRSIYDKPVHSYMPESTPINSRSRKRVKRIIDSDSDSEYIPGSQQEQSTGLSKKNAIVYDNSADMDETNFEEQSESSEEVSSNSQDQSKSSGNDYERKASKSMTSHSSYEERDTSQSSLVNDVGNVSAVKKQSNSKSNVYDLTMKDSNNHHSIRESNKNIKQQQKVDVDEIIICSSSSTSENEMDKELLTFAKKEIGVGNLDPIEAQKKEHLLLSIDFVEKQLEKLKKFTTTLDINKLPDKGAKVQENIKLQEEKKLKLKAELSKLSHNSTPSIPTRESFQTPEIRRKFWNENDIKSVKLSEGRLDKVKMNSNLKKNYANNNLKNETIKKDTKFSNQFNEFDVRDIPTVPQTSFDVADLGEKALATLNKQQTLTHQRLEQLHKSLTSRPGENKIEKDPSGLKVPLMPHQQHALAWMKWRETQKPKGGILADDMGLGKTLTTISLVLATVNEENSSNSNDSSDDDGWVSRKKHKRYYGGTLVICPASLIKQWEAEVKNRCKQGLLSVLVYHGNNRSMEDRKLSKFNIVITTYQIIVREADAKTGLYRMEWNRIILDEAHYVRNHKSKACISVCGLNAKHRWALTGTPIQNKEMDLYAILQFLKCSPFDNLHVWKRWVDNKNEAGKQRLITIMKSLMLRRTKQELQAKGVLQSLPDKNLEIIEIKMDHEENLVYQKILLFSQNLFAQFLAQRAEKQHTRELYGGKFDKPSSLGAKTQFTKAQKVLLEHHSNIEAHEILVLLLRLRQMCCHPALIHSMLDKQDAEMNGLDEEDVSGDLINKLHSMSINEDDENIEEHVANYKIDERVAANLLTKNNPVFNNDRRSSKTRAIMKTIKEVLKKRDKIIVVSQWTSFLRVVAKNLDNIEDANYAMFTGEVAVKNRQAIVEQLNDPKGEINILLLSLTAGGVGLNLVGANHLLLIDIHWNPQLEAQAQDRIYRFGQNKSVYIYKFICKDTIEERIKNLQTKKLEIANDVLTGTRSVSSKLTIEDIKLLFS